MDQQIRQLLCTFSTLAVYADDVEKLKKVFYIDGPVYVLQNIINPNEIFLTYNVMMSSGNRIHFPKTITVHRKRGFNVIYSINALNMMARTTEGGINGDFVVDWGAYRGSLVTVCNGEFSVVRTSLLQIIGRN